MLIKNELEVFLKDYKKVIIMGVGNPLKSDDGLGPFIIEGLKDIENENILLIDASTAPENFTGKIIKEKPSHLIIIDATLMDREVGHIETFKKEDFASVGVSTHSMSLSFLIKYLESFNVSNILFIGIQPENMDFSLELTPNVKKNSIKLINLIKTFFKYEK